MEQSAVFNRIHFLLALQRASVRDRVNMLRNLTPGQMECIGQVARTIYDQNIAILPMDINFFRHKILILRRLFSCRVNFVRKVTTLVRHHDLIPKLLRVYYILSTIRHQLQTTHEA